MYNLARELTEFELRQVVQIMSKIHKCDFEVEEVYDEWTIVFYSQEFEKKSQYLDNKELIKLNEINEQIKKIDFEKLPKAYIHADIIKANLILDRKGKIWVIDFSVLNYLPRIIDLAVTAAGTCVTDSKEETIQKINILLNQYSADINLTKEEYEMFLTIFNGMNAMYILQANFIKKTGYSTIENDYWMQTGKKALEYNIKQEDIKINF